jgi:cysteinyl-tRNA synthetase
MLIRHQEGSLNSERGESRVETDGKEDFRDFALWKTAKASEVGFDSPWGWGRPGWHIECSAMIDRIFGGSVTIHGGGTDLKFPHHQSEIMQSEPITGRPLADVWMHNGSVLSNGQKMSKSVGNFVTWRAALDKAESLAPGLGSDLLRMTLLQTHWQKPLDWSDSALLLTRGHLMTLTKGLNGVLPANSGRYVSELYDNLNTPQALAWLHQRSADGHFADVVEGLLFLGVNVDAWSSFIVKSELTLSSDYVAELHTKREIARSSGDWTQADAIRKLLLDGGVSLSDAKVKII